MLWRPIAKRTRSRNRWTCCLPTLYVLQIPCNNSRRLTVHSYPKLCQTKPVTPGPSYYLRRGLPEWPEWPEWRWQAGYRAVFTSIEKGKRTVITARQLNRIRMPICPPALRVLILNVPTFSLCAFTSITRSHWFCNVVDLIRCIVSLIIMAIFEKQILLKEQCDSSYLLHDITPPNYLFRCYL